MNKIFHEFGIALILIIFLTSCAPSSPTPNSPAYWPTTGWRSTSPEEQGMDSEKLAQMVEHIQQEKLDLDSLLVIRNGYLVSELYRDPYTAEQPHVVFSVTKSVIDTLIGIAIQKGYIRSVRQPLIGMLPAGGVANLDDSKKAITLENLLTQTSGLDCNENPAPGEPSVFTSDDWVKFVLDQPMVAKPGEKFNYCTGATHLLSAVLQSATGVSALKFANQSLFTPLGIGPLDEMRWPSDPQGVTIGGFGLALTPREMAKLGFLFLHKGQWDGETVVPLDWVVTSTASHANRGEKKEYGYLWWIDPQGKWYAALGLHGQHIFVYPAENLVVVSTAALPAGNDADLIPIQELLDGYILPAVKSDRPLPPNPDGQARLAAATLALGQAEKTVSPPLPAIATEISGKTYTFEENPFGWRTMIFTFQPGSDEAKITINGMRQFPVGLDNRYRIYSVENPTFPQAFRGHWDDGDTFVIEDPVLGQVQDNTIRVKFTGEAIDIAAQEKYSGNQVEVQGTLDPASK
jgi:CubicO group peptidase (beta-lactamase class C family)